MHTPPTFLSLCTSQISRLCLEVKGATIQRPGRVHHLHDSPSQWVSLIEHKQWRPSPENWYMTLETLKTYTLDMYTSINVSDTLDVYMTLEIYTRIHTYVHIMRHSRPVHGTRNA